MKRILASILALTILCGLLGGCGEGRDITESGAVTQQTDPVIEEIRPAPTETEAVGNQDPDPTEAEYFYEAKYTRLSEEPIKELIPNDNYGCILPFCAGLEQDYVCGDPYGHYGFMDATGMILVDPVYQYIEALHVEDGYDFAPCVWLMMKGEVQQSDPSGYHYHLNDRKCGLATGDGSVVIDLVYDDIDVLGDHIFAKKYLDEDYAKYDVDIYNFDCELIGSLTNLEAEILGYRDGVLRVTKDWEFYYMDVTGNIFAGPFSNAEDFSCGYGLVQVETEYGSKYTYVDKKGELLSKEGWTFVAEEGETYQITGFDYAESFVGGVACVQVNHLWEQYSVLTTDNTFLFDFRILNPYRCTEDYIFNHVLGGTEVYNHKGELLWSVPELELSSVYGCEDAFLYDPYENKIYNWKTGEVMEGVEGVTDVGFPYPYTEDFAYLLFVDEEKEECILADEEMDILARMDRYAYQRRDLLTGKDYFIDQTSLIMPHLPQPVVSIEEIAADKEVRVYNDLIQCTDGGACCYYNYDMELIFCYPFNEYVLSVE